MTASTFQQSERNTGFNHNERQAHKQTEMIDIDSNAVRTAHVTPAKNNLAINAYHDAIHLSDENNYRQVADIMSSPVTGIHGQMSMLDAHFYFSQCGFKQLPVTGHNQIVIGLLSRIDLMQYIIHDGKQIHYLSNKVVCDAMSKDFMSITPDTDIISAAKILQHNSHNALPVVDDTGILIGILTRGDILGALIDYPQIPTNS